MMREPMTWTDETNGLATLCADARVLPLAPPRHGRAVCICSNLTTTADAFAQLSGEELFALPAGLRRHVHDALVGVWQILDLVQRMEEAGLGVEGVEPDLCSRGSDQPHRSQDEHANETPWLHRVSRALLHRLLPGA
jgi:hypothetical protein